MPSGRRRKQAIVVAVTMGYGHWRTAYPFLPWAAGGEILTADSYPGIPKRDRAIWQQSERFYNIISRFAARGFIGRSVFSFFDYFQRVPPRYGEEPPTIQLKSIYRAIEGGWGKDFIGRLGREPLPFVTTFFAIAYMAEYFKYPGQIYLIVTDADVSRAWAPLHPAATRINFLVPTEWAKRRLAAYGVPRRQIFLTGFPLPPFHPRSMRERFKRLDPKSAKSPRILFSLGGAGAQARLASTILRSLGDLLRREECAFSIAVGRFNAAARMVGEAIEELDLAAHVGKSIFIIANQNLREYIEVFTKTLDATDILWTKPSELSFYAALGIPILMAPPIGSHEERNRAWLLELGAGIDQGDPRRAEEWLPRLLESGELKKAAQNGFRRGNRHGLKNILDVVFDH